jgi:hypothetical protein
MAFHLSIVLTLGYYNSSQKHHVTLRERSSRPKSLIFSVVEILRAAQDDVFEITCSVFSIRWSGINQMSATIT